MAAMEQNIVMEKVVSFKPVNRHIQIELSPPTAVDAETTILLPADFKPKEERHVVATVVSWADDVRFAENLKEGIEIVVDNSMIEQININNSQLSVIQDNYIIAILI
jgi:co-chaperonin GroES (HSP10)